LPTQTHKHRKAQITTACLSQTFNPTSSNQCGVTYQATDYDQNQMQQFTKRPLIQIIKKKSQFVIESYLSQTQKLQNLPCFGIHGIDTGISKISFINHNNKKGRNLNIVMIF